jgi:hypothetical protein
MLTQAADLAKANANVNETKQTDTTQLVTRSALLRDSVTRRMTDGQGCRGTCAHGRRFARSHTSHAHRRLV